MPHATGGFRVLWVLHVRESKGARVKSRGGYAVRTQKWSFTRPYKWFPPTNGYCSSVYLSMLAEGILSCCCSCFVLEFIGLILSWIMLCLDMFGVLYTTTIWNVGIRRGRFHQLDQVEPCSKIPWECKDTWLLTITP